MTLGRADYLLKLGVTMTNTEEMNTSPNTLIISKMFEKIM